MKINDMDKGEIIDAKLKDIPFTMIASEAALAKNWLLEEEDIAWQYLQKGK